MIHPSERIHREMISEHASLWFVPTLDRNHAILLKAPSNVLKAIKQGCNIEMIFSAPEINNKKYFSSAVKIFDDVKCPFIISGAHTHFEEHKALLEIINRKETPFFLFDEADRCVSWANSFFEQKNIEIIKDIIGDRRGLYEGEFDKDASLALDCLEFSLDPSIKDFKNAYEIPLVKTSFHTGRFTDTTIYTIGDRESFKFEIGSSNEGDSFEQSVWHMIQDIFGENIFRSPHIQEGSTERELIDILGISKFGIFLFEMKSISILNASLDRSMDRKIKGVQKQVKKALRQLKGSINSIQSGNQVKSLKGDLIEIDPNIVPHAVVLISEMFQYGDWDEIVKLTFQASKETNAMFHILDLKELALLIKVSKEKDIFDYYLIERFKHFIEAKNIFIRGRIAPKSI